ncbi:MAG TPA: ABC transporter permease [Clostridia bacterium]|nr:ABC transporter permease [Clostridia bacterium]
MNKSAIFRLFEYLLTFAIIITLNFALPRMMPGDPFLILSGDGGEVFSEQSYGQIEYYKEYYGLNQPYYRQYISYLKDLSQGYLGFSFHYKADVLTIVLQRLPWTMLLVLTSMGVSLLLGVALGSYSAWAINKWQDKFLYTVLVILSEIPAFLVGLALLIVFGAGLGIFPISGSMTQFAAYNNIWEQSLDVLHHLVLPALTLSLARTGGIYLLVRNSLGTVLTKEYIRTARAKGLREFRVRYLHALRNALMPLFTRIATQLGAALGGAVLAESVFSYPGLGVLMRDAVMVRDYPLLQGIFLVMAFTVILANFLADTAYRWIDPRTE